MIAQILSIMCQGLVMLDVSPLSGMVGIVPSDVVVIGWSVVGSTVVILTV